MTMIYDPIPCAKLVQKIGLETTSLLYVFAGNYLYLICTTCKCCSCCELKINFQNVSPPYTNMKAPNGRISDNGSAQARRHGGAFGGSYPQIFFEPPKFCCAQKN